MTTQALLDTIASLDTNMTPNQMAKLAFNDGDRLDQHLQDQAKSHKNLLSFYGYLDSGNRRRFCKWLDSYHDDNAKHA